MTSIVRLFARLMKITYQQIHLMGGMTYPKSAFTNTQIIERTFNCFLIPKYSVYTQVWSGFHGDAFAENFQRLT